MTIVPPTRRKILGLGAAAIATGAAAAVTTAFSSPTYAALSIPKPGRRELKLFALHSEESFSGVYWANGRYVPGALSAISSVMRDRRDNSKRQIDPELLNVLVSLRDVLGTTQPIHIICGYRSPSSNAMMARMSSGVASNSYHMQGKAIDLRVPGRPLAMVRKAALHLGRGGVGYYPDSDFVHVDSGPPRHW